jgi:NAD(P)-dependent dehydrogenase (short-subunit alcohol dehydrogenase family)
LLTSIAGRVAIVTGASKGVGKGIASVFVHHGVKVLVVSRNRVEATATAVELGDGGGRVPWTLPPGKNPWRWPKLRQIILATSTSFAPMPESSPNKY